MRVVLLVSEDTLGLTIVVGIVLIIDETTREVITGRTVREEATSDKTFDLVKWIRVRKLQ